MYVARNKDGTLNLFLDFPERASTFWANGMRVTRLNPKLFLNLTWHDEPVKVKLVEVS